jgi:hypothetical protein
MIRTPSVLSLVALALLAAAARADVVTLIAARDNTLFNDPAGALSNGSGPVMIVGRSGGASTAPVRRGVVRFDVAAAIPVGSTIHSAQLVLANPSGNSGARTVELHRVLQDWGEGASNTTSGQGAAAEPGDATWLNTFFPGALWSSPGGDFEAAISSQQIVDAFGVYTWPSTAIAVSDVQDWLDQPANNFGWLLKLDVETVSQSTKVFGTREASDPSEHPKLVVSFDPPPVFTYCSARTSSLGCTPTIGWSGAPSASAGAGFAITLAQALNRKPGVLVYGLNGPAATPFLGGTLCAAPPLRRSAFLWTAGSASGADCSGSLALDFNARIASGVDPALVAGAVVHAQWLTRDPGNAAGSFNSSDALRFAIAL